MVIIWHSQMTASSWLCTDLCAGREVLQTNDKVQMRTEGLGLESPDPGSVSFLPVWLEESQAPSACFLWDASGHLTPCKLQMLQGCILSATHPLGTPEWLGVCSSLASIHRLFFVFFFLSLNLCVP